MQNKKSKDLLALFFILILILEASCGKEEAVSKNNFNPDVIAIINGEKLRTVNFKRALNLTSRQYRIEDKEDLPKNEILFLKLKTLNRMIQNILFRQEAKKNKTELNAKELKHTKEIIKSDYLDDSYQQAFKVQNISQEEWEEKLRDSLIVKNLINEQVNSKVSVSEELAKKYFTENPEEFQKGDQVQALHIIVATEEEARKLLNKIRSGKANFGEIAIKHSLGPERVEGGNLGYFEKGQMPAEFDGVFNLKVYETSDVIRTPYGYHILKVVDKKKTRKMSFKESRNFIQAKLLRKKQEEAFQTWAVDLKNKAIIKMNYDAIEKIK